MRFGGGWLNAEFLGIVVQVRQGIISTVITIQVGGWEGVGGRVAKNRLGSRHSTLLQALLRLGCATPNFTVILQNVQSALIFLHHRSERRLLACACVHVCVYV